MQSLPIFVVELQAAKKALLRNFESEGNCGLHQEGDVEAHGYEERRISIGTSWRRYPIRLALYRSIILRGRFSGLKTGALLDRRRDRLAKSD
jgi:hypothetical protein